ncbi:alpha/beta hydrolase [Microbulbifer sp. ZKSA006]|uniref:alpha/beta hydrolase n=1 Tax=Microbulbifer sp. ZKSA006 TaxID=3243390 RepID=UPI00403A5504
MLFLIGSLCGAYFVYLLILFFLQNQLIFPGRKTSLIGQLRYIHYQQKIITHDKKTLYGWTIYTKEYTQKKSPIHLIYFGGNTEEVSTTLELLLEFGCDAITTFNYRGYGISEGNPSEKALLGDAITIYDTIKKNDPKAKLVVMGHSLGSAIAAYLTKVRKPGYLILCCPLHSIEKIAMESYYVPKFLVRQKFTLAKYARHIQAKVLALIAKNDSVIPYKHSLQALKQLPENSQIEEIASTDHNEVLSSTRSRETVRHFIKSIS